MRDRREANKARFKRIHIGLIGEQRRGELELMALAGKKWDRTELAELRDKLRAWIGARKP
jgi:hypothetical protein